VNISRQSGRRLKIVVENSWKFYVDAKSHVGGKKQKKVSARRRGRESKRKKLFENRPTNCNV
jgi:hypothetical protein